MPTLFVSAIAIDPQNPSTIFAGAGTQEDGDFIGGVFRSMDGGTTWSATSLRCSVENLAIDILNSNTLYAATDCGLYKTTDGGESWNLLNTGPGPTSAIAIDPLNPDTIYTNGSFNCVLIRQGFVQAACGWLYKSVDGGISWIVTDSGLPDRAIVSALSIGPVNPNILYAQVSNADPNKAGLYKSTDGAATWKTIGNGRLLAIDPQGVLYATMTGGLFRSTDEGATWTNAGAGPPTTPGPPAFTVYAPSSVGVLVVTFAP
jgi:photosystem II stability/assembly factor-like uncharacterized protein